MEMSLFLVQLLNGIQYGLLLFLVASGLTLVFGVMGILNLAHGSMYMIGAYLVYYFAAMTTFTAANGHIIFGLVTKSALLKPGIVMRVH